MGYLILSVFNEKELKQNKSGNFFVDMCFLHAMVTMLYDNVLV